MQKFSKAAVGVAALFVIGWMIYVWPTSWRYFQYEHNNGAAIHRYHLRVNRFSGKTEYLNREGWNCYTNSTFR